MSGYRPSPEELARSARDHAQADQLSAEHHVLLTERRHRGYRWHHERESDYDRWIDWNMAVHESGYWFLIPNQTENWAQFCAIIDHHEATKAEK